MSKPISQNTTAAANMTGRKALFFRMSHPFSTGKKSRPPLTANQDPMEARANGRAKTVWDSLTNEAHFLMEENIEHYRTSNIQHPTSNIEHRTSDIQHPTSNGHAAPPEGYLARTG